MAKTTRPRARMDRYFKHLQKNSYILSYNKQGSNITKIKKWDLIKRLTKKIHSEDELPGIKVPEEARYLDSAVKYLPRQDVMLYGMIPALEQRVYSTCKNCSRVFNPRDVLSHRACTKSHTLYSGLLKKKVKSENGNSKSLSSNGSSHLLNNTSLDLPSSSSLLNDPVKDSEFKRPHTPPPKEVRKLSQGETFSPTTNTSKSASESMPTNAPSVTTSSDTSESKPSSSKISSHHNPSSSWSKHYNSKSFSSHNSDEVFRFGKLAMTVAASSSKSTPMDTLPPSSSSHLYHHHGTSSSSSRHQKSSSDSSKLVVRHGCMAKTTKPRARMDRYFKHLQKNSYILSCNKQGSTITKIKKWDLIIRLTKKLHSKDELPGIKVPEEARYLDSAVKYLPRKDVMLYGMIPALEQRVYSTCKNCSRVFNPRDVLSHRACTKSHTPYSGLLKKKVKSENGNSKSLSSNGCSHLLNNTSLDLPSSSSLLNDPVKDFEFKRPHTPPPKEVRKPSQGETFSATTDTSKSASTTTNAPPVTISSDKSESKESSSKISSHHDISDYDPDLHCGVIEHNRIPCMRSITCSNHRIQLRKQVSGRSKDIHQLIAEKKAAKENDVKHTTPCFYMSRNGEATDIVSSGTTYVPIADQLVSTSIDSSHTNSFVHLVPKFSTHQSRHSTISVLSKKLSSGKDEKESAKVMTNGYIAQAKNLENTQDNPPVGTDPVLIVPASPVSVVSSVQLLEIGNNIMSLESPQSASNPPVRKQMVLPVSSNHTRAIRMYKSHPKPTVFPNFGARRLGGAILLSNPLITDRKNDLLSVINGDSKGLVQDVNGFILHADVSQTVEAQQFSEENNSSQHKFIISLIKKHGF